MQQTSKTELLYGRQPILEAIIAGRKIYEIYGTESAIKWLFKKIRIKNYNIDIKYKILTKSEIYEKINRKDHQGLIALSEDFKYTNFNIILSRHPKIILSIDRITDTHNLGAIIRTANIFNVGGIVLQTRNCARITPVVVHISSGATEHTPICIVDSIAHTLKLCKENGYSIIAGVKPQENSISIQNFKCSNRVVLILGSEGEGIKDSLLKKCDLLLSIPQAGEIESLNVSVAAGIILYQIALKVGMLKYEIQK